MVVCHDVSSGLLSRQRKQPSSLVIGSGISLHNSFSITKPWKITMQAWAHTHNNGWPFLPCYAVDIKITTQSQLISLHKGLYEKSLGVPRTLNANVLYIYKLMLLGLYSSSLYLSCHKRWFIGKGDTRNALYLKKKSVPTWVCHCQIYFFSAVIIKQTSTMCKH